MPPRTSFSQLARLISTLLVTGAVAPIAGAQFSGQYYSGTDFDSLVLEREDEVIDFDWGSGSPDALVPDDQFSVRWTGTVVPTSSETYTLYVNHDDGVRLYVDGQLVIDDWTGHPVQEHSAAVELEQGQEHEVVLEYFENIGEAVVRLEWASATQSRKLVATGPQSGLDQLAPFAEYFGDVFPRRTPGQGKLIPTPLTGDLGLGMILTITHAPGSNLLHVGSRDGRVLIVDPYDPVVPPVPFYFLDIRDRVLTNQDSGLLGIVFHPEYASPGSDHEGELFVYYVYQENEGRFLRVSRFQADADRTWVDPTSEEILIQQRSGMEDIHYGGGLVFGPDGFLYIAIGELGETTLAQELDNRFVGSILRIDVDQNPLTSHPITVPLAPGDSESYSQGYFVPNDNPFIGAAPGALEEVYTLGLRNPHRMTIDSVSGTILLGDVGSTGGQSREEINRVVAGANYGWPFREGTSMIGTPPAVVYGDLTDPEIHYPRSEGACVIGGYVYRGSLVPWLQGRYVFGDYNSGKLYAALDEYGSAPKEEIGLQNVLPGLVTFGTDHQGELYASAGLDSILYRFEPAPTVSEPPTTLSATGVFADLDTLTPVPGFLPYDVNAPLWSDGAAKRRWVGFPQNGSTVAPWQRITFSLYDPWKFPMGSVFIKHFELPLDGGGVRRLETRFMVHGDDGKFYGVTYRWRPDGSDADLLTEAFSEDVGGQIWNYPGRDDCNRCHNPSSGYVLGLNTSQLNRDLHYSTTQRTANQLVTLNELDLFKTMGTPEIEDETFDQAPRTVGSEEANEFLETRARSYLAANCAHCHLPDGVGRGAFDTRFSTPLGHQNLILGEVAEDLGVAGAQVIDPQSPDTSMLLLRILAMDATAMPPIGNNLVHPQATDLVQAWVQSANPVAKNWQVEWFNGSNLSTSVATETTEELQFEWKLDAPVSGVNVNAFSARFQGTIVAPTTETYTFHVLSDDGARLWVDGVLLVDTWGSLGHEDHRADLDLVAGQPVPVVLEYREKGGEASVRLDWSTPTMARTALPAVDPNNTPPVAYEQILLAPKDGQLTLELEGTDLEQAGLDVALRQLPEHGTLEGIGPEFVYRPDPGYEGPDSFTFVVHDGERTSEPATVSIEVHCTDCGGSWNYCTTTPNSVGPGAMISSTGSTSVAAADFRVQIQGGVPGQFGVFYYGAGSGIFPFGDGQRCVTSGGVGIFRLPIVQTGPGGDAERLVDYSAPPTAAGQINGGSTWYFQFWYRDPTGGPVGFNLSDGLEVQFLP